MDNPMQQPSEGLLPPSQPAAQPAPAAQLTEPKAYTVTTLTALIAKVAGAMTDAVPEGEMRDTLASVIDQIERRSAGNRQIANALALCRKATGIQSKPTGEQTP